MRKVIIPPTVATVGALEALDHEGEPGERCAKLVPPQHSMLPHALLVPAPRYELQMTTSSAEQLTYLASCVPRPRAPKKPYTRFCEELC